MRERIRLSIKTGKVRRNQPCQTQRVLAKTIKIEYVHILLRQFHVYTFIVSTQIDDVL